MSALGGVYTALKTLIAADPTVAGLIANSPGAWVGTAGKAVYDDGRAPQGGSYPLITVGAGTEVQFSSFRQRGWNCTVQIKPIARPESDVQPIVTALSTLLLPGDGLTLTVPGFASSWVEDFSPVPALQEIVAGVPVVSVPIIVRVYAT